MNTRILALYLPLPPSAESLPELAAFLLQLSPRVGVRPPDILYIDVTASLRLFGGEEKIVSRLAELLKEKKVRGQLALADDVATAGAVAQVAMKAPVIVPTGKSDEALAPLPTDLLFFFADPLSPLSPPKTKAVGHIVHLLSLLGIQTLGGFSRIPASTIGPRFGELGVELHRRARGVGALPFKPFEPSIPYRESVSFEDSVSLLEPLLFTAKNLLCKLEQRLAKNLHSASELRIFLETERCEEVEITVPLPRPLRKEGALFNVVREKLSRTSFEAPLVSLAIELSLPVRTRQSQFHLFETNEQQNEKLEELLARLVAGVGPTLISAAVLRERHRPEQTWQPTEFNPIQSASETDPTPASLPERPTLLLSPPTSFREPVRMLHGPERLAGEWWTGEPYARDYFVAETSTGQRLWLFKDLDNEKLFLHGYFD